ncbi:MAG: hypothetical protein JXA94_05280 [Parachlamydiales bacterium]|nr:hypothetical protein [Parachlamydiales bacterium]
MAAITIHTNINQNNTTQEEPPKPAQKNAFDESANFFSNSHKDLFRLLRLSSEWARLIIADLEVFEPLGTFIAAIKTGEEALCFADFGKSISNSVANAIKLKQNNKSIAKDGVSVLSELRTNSFQSIWDFCKVAKWFNKVNVFSLNSKLITNLSALGGTSFAISSSEKMYNEGIKLFIINYESKQYTKDPLQKEKLYQVLRIAKNIGTLAIGLLVVISAIFGLIAPVIVNLFIATMLLTCSITSTILGKTKITEENPTSETALLNKKYKIDKNSDEKKEYTLKQRLDAITEKKIYNFKFE